MGGRAGYIAGMAGWADDCLVGRLTGWQRWVAGLLAKLARMSTGRAGHSSQFGLPAGRSGWAEQAARLPGLSDWPTCWPGGLAGLAGWAAWYAG